LSVLPVGFGSAVAGGYQIERSLRLDGAAYLNRTFSTPTSNTTWSWSCWLKRSTLATTSFILGLSSDCGFGFTATDELRLWNNAGTTLVTSTAVFRDPSAWYHIVFISNGTTIKGYVNNVEYLSYTGTVTNINSAVVHNIGRDPTGTRFYVGGYLAEVYFIDGSAKIPSDFGQVNSETGVWGPKAYSGTYGTNGFYLNFSDNSNTTAATLGKDYSGNGNNWTPNGFSVTAGVGNDSLVDSPTSYGTDTGAGGEVRGNYATANPLWKGASVTLANGNLDVSATSVGSRQGVIASIFVSSGKWYFEYIQNADSNSNLTVGIADTSFNATNSYVGQTATTYGYTARSNTKYNNNTGTSYGTGSSTNGDVLMCAFDLDNGKIYFGKNGTWYGSGDPVAGTNAAFTGISGTYCPAYGHNATASQSTGITFNFGQRPFEKWNGSAYVANTAPSGFKALCTQNLTTPTIGATSTTQADNYFDVGLVNGSASVDQTITTAFAPDFYWSKNRNSTVEHGLYNTIVGGNKYLSSNATTTETTTTASVVTFNSTGVSLKAGGSIINDATRTYVGWLWRGGGTGVTNTAGSITSTVSANTTSGFSIVTYTGTGANATVGHGLGAIPAMIMVKNRDSGAIGGAVYHTSMGATKYLKLFQTTTGSDPEATDNTAWNGSSPTFNTNVFSVGSLNRTNSSQQMVAYCFAAVAGYSAFGGYTGNGSADGPFVYVGFRPAFVMLKAYIGSGENWGIYDKSRVGYNSSNYVLFPNLTNAEIAATTHIDLLSNGFKLRSSNNNLSSYSYIYAAFAETPFKYSLARFLTEIKNVSTKRQSNLNRL